MKKLQVVYVGERAGKDDKTFSVLLEGGKEDKALYFKKMRGYHQIGTTYVLEKEGDQYTFPRRGLQESEKQIPVTEKQIDEWKKEHDLDKAELIANRERKKINNDSKMFEALAPIGEDYFKATKVRRIAIELSLIHWLRCYIPTKFK